METTDGKELDRVLNAAWPEHLLLTDQPENWRRLVEQIAELEELLTDLHDIRDVHASRTIGRLKALLESKRRSLREMDVG
jgi:hypothetical protein